MNDKKKRNPYHIVLWVSAIFFIVGSGLSMWLLFVPAPFGFVVPYWVKLWLMIEVLSSCGVFLFCSEFMNRGNFK